MKWNSATAAFVDNHAVVRGPSKFGRNNHFYSFCSIGGDAQDLTYHGERAWLEVGDANEFREFSTANRGTDKGGNVTRIGSNNLIMAYAHIAHDCVIGNRVVLENGAQLAGHIHVDDYAVVCAFCLVHQFTRIGQHSYIGANTVITQDVMPFSMVVAPRGTRCYGINSVGLERRGYSPDRIKVDRTGIPLPSPLQAKYRASSRENAWNPGPLRGRPITHPVYRVGNWTRLDEIGHVMAASRKHVWRTGDSSLATATFLSSY